VVADGLYFRQLLAGRDFARRDPVAAGMLNFAYLVGDRGSGEALAVDPAWDVGGIAGVAEADGMRIVGVLCTHHHPDHVGGPFMGHRVQGLAELLEREDVPVHVAREEAPLVCEVTGLAPSQVVPHASGDTLRVGSVEVELIHTPGHTPGSQCFLVGGRLLAGDTLFLEGCGRTDLPGSDPEAMYHSLVRLARLPDDTVVYPGHRYSVASAATLEAVKEINAVLKPPSLDAWLAAFGRPTNRT